MYAGRFFSVYIGGPMGWNWGGPIGWNWGGDGEGYTYKLYLCKNAKYYKIKQTLKQYYTL